MITIFTLAIVILIIYGSAIVWCIRSGRKVFGKPSAKVIKMYRERHEMLMLELDEKLSMNLNTQSC